MSLSFRVRTGLKQAELLAQALAAGTAPPAEAAPEPAEDTAPAAQPAVKKTAVKKLKR